MVKSLNEYELCTDALLFYLLTQIMMGFPVVLEHDISDVTLYCMQERTRPIVLLMRGIMELLAVKYEI